MFRCPKQNGEQLSLLLFFVLDVAEKLMINVEKRMDR